MSSHKKKTTKQVCRTCLLKHKTVSSIFTIDSTIGLGYDVIVSMLIGIEVKQDDPITTNICPACKQAARSAYQFVDQARISHETLVKAYLGKTKVKTLKVKKIEVDIEVKKETKDNIKQEKEEYGFDDGYTSPTDYEAINKIEINVEKLKTDIDSSAVKCERNNFCPVCGDNFADAFELLTHAVTHDIKKKDESNLPCRQKNYSKLPEYVKYVHPQKEMTGEVDFIQDTIGTYRCGICSQECRSDEELQKHFSKHAFIPVTRCALCEKHFVESMYLQRHLSSAHTDAEVASHKMAAVHVTTIGTLAEQRQGGESINASICPQCGELLLTSAELTEHNSSQHPEFIHRCLSCFKVFKNEKMIQTHGRSCYGRLTYTCDRCNTRLPSEALLKKHSRRHQSSGSGLRHECYICNKRFKKPEELDRHKYRSHRPTVDGKVVFECDVCRAKCDQKWNLKSHMKIHDANRKRPVPRYLCRFCGKVSSHSGNLITHIRRHHTGEKPYKCGYCDKAFVRTLDRTMHERHMHTGVKPYACQYCGHRFVRSSSLTTHLRVHTGEKPFKCVHCGQGFSQSHDRTKHERRHTGEVAHACLCGQSFNKAKELTQHKTDCPFHRDSHDNRDLAQMKQQMELARSFTSLSHA